MTRGPSGGSRRSLPGGALDLGRARRSLPAPQVCANSPGARWLAGRARSRAPLVGGERSGGEESASLRLSGLSMAAKLGYLLALVCLLTGCTEPLTASREDWLQPQRPRHWRDGPNAAQQLRLRRRQVELAVNRLHILESLDGQLEKFAKLSPSVLTTGQQRRQQQQKQQQQHQQQYQHPQQQLACALELTGDAHTAGKLASCLDSVELARRVPAYMLNLRRRLLGAPSQPSTAVRSLMPYKSLVVRSFAQPSANPKGKFRARARE